MYMFVKNIERTTRLKHSVSYNRETGFIDFNGNEMFHNDVFRKHFINVSYYFLFFRKVFHGARRKENFQS